MRNPHRVFEIDPHGSKLADGGRQSFMYDFLGVLDQCLNAPSGHEDPRARLNMPAEPYRPPAEMEGNKEALSRHALSLLQGNEDKWEWLYDNLEDYDSRRLFLLVLAYRAIGWKNVKLPLDNDQFWSAISEIGTLASGNDVPKHIHEKLLQRFSLRRLGRDIIIYSDPFGVFNEFIYPQYYYRGFDKVVAPKAGDYVLDCGACYGGTTVNFADAVGPEGRVYSFEFMPENIAVYQHNVHENVGLHRRISLLNRPVSFKSDEVMSISGTGPGTQVHVGAVDGAEQVRSIAIDDFVSGSGLPRVDFIKMDIEGSEIDALKGAGHTIERFKPKMAICVYHNLWDFYEVPRLLKGIREDYKFYFGHSTAHGDESVIFAV